MKTWDARVMRLFHEARELPAAERESFLEAECGPDDKLRDSVRELLLNITEGERLFADDARLMLVPLDEPDGEFAHFTLDEQLGQGGMGVVYRAQDQQHERVVALKLLAAGLNDSADLARFEEERRILGQLNHPSIATLYESGREHGQPWFSMEYVEGEHLDVYCDRLPVGERLRVFRQVVEAVQAAHRKRIIHGDLKPSNILVRADGSVKLLDFGIARKLDAEDQEAGQPRARRMSPQYASPEQVSGEALDTASDVYSLGVVLYRLLTGRVPFDVAEFPALQRMIREERPQAPSVTGRLRGRELTRRQWADLDALCAKAMEKSADERYAGASDVLRDLDAFFAHQPLAALRRDPLVFRATRFMRRNRAVLIPSGAVALLVVGLTVAFLYQLAQEKNRVVEAALLAERAQWFTEALFLGDKNAGIPTAPLRPIVGRAASIVSGVRSQPKLQARLYLMMATAHESLGEFDAALGDLGQAVALARAVHGVRSAEAVESQARLVIFLVSQSRAKEAEALAFETLRDAERLTGRTAAAGAANLAMSKLLRAKDDHVGSLQRAQQAAGIYAGMAGQERQHTDALNSAAIAQHNLARYDEALGTNQTVLALHRGMFGEQHVMLADDYINIGVIHSTRGHYDEALRAYEEARRINESWYGPRHPEVGAVYLKFSNLYRVKEEPAVAGRWSRQALEIMRASYPQPHRRVANALNEQASVYLGLDDRREAERMYRQSFAIYSALYGPMHPDSVVILTNLGDLLVAGGELDRGEAIYRQGLRTWAHAMESVPAAVIRLRIGDVMLRRKNWAAAKAELTAAYEVFVKTVGPDAGNTKAALRRLKLLPKV